jgi:hypothetical protein
MNKKGAGMPSQRDQFFRDGWLTLDAVVPQALCVAAVAEAAQVRQARGGDRLQDAWRDCSAVRQIATLPGILAVLEALYARQPVPFQTLNFGIGTAQAAHSDTVHFNSLPAGFMCGVWVALEDVHPDSGPLIFWPGTHTWPELVPYLLSGPQTYPDYEAHIRRQLEGQTSQLAILPRGTALIWAANLLHGGAPIVDRTKTRHSQVTHYFFAGCRYHTPLLSSAAEIHWRHPEPIRP